MKHVFIGKAISVAQPWASAIVFAGKDIENRSWYTHYRGPIAIHASGTLRKDCHTRLQRQTRGGARRPLIDWIVKGQRHFNLDDQHQGIVLCHVLGIAMLVDCVQKTSSPWYIPGNWGWVLEGIVPVQPVPISGSLGLWNCKFGYTPLAHR